MEYLKCYMCGERKRREEGFSKKERKRGNKRKCRSCVGEKLDKKTTKKRLYKELKTKLNAPKGRSIHGIFKMERRKVTKDFRESVLTRDDFVCHYCSKAGDTIDHKKPISYGGLTNEENCVCACSLCNNRKADTPYEQYIEKYPIVL